MCTAAITIGERLTEADGEESQSDALNSVSGESA